MGRSLFCGWDTGDVGLNALLSLRKFLNSASSCCIKWIVFLVFLVWLVWAELLRGRRVSCHVTCYML